MEVLARLHPGISPRRTKRPSRGTRNDENANPTPPGGKLTHMRGELPPNRFGFKTQCAASSPAAASEAADATFDEAFTELTRVFDECLGDLDAATPLLKTRTLVGKLDFTQAKAKVAELRDLVKQLKAALAEQLKRARLLYPAVAEFQKELKARLCSQTQAFAASRDEVEKLNFDLSISQKRAEEQGRQIEELRNKTEELARRETEALQAAHELGERAEQAEGTLARLEKELEASTEREEELRGALSHREEAAGRAEAQLAELELHMAREVEEAAARMEELRVASAQEESRLKEDLAREKCRVSELDSQLSTLQIANSGLEKAHTSLQLEHRDAREMCTSQRERLDGLEAQLAEKSAALAAKDTDLREAINNVTQMQRDNMEIMNRERSRVEALEERCRLSQLRESELTVNLGNIRGELERMVAEHAECKAELREALAGLQFSNAERERLAIETAEQKDAILVHSTARAKLDESLKETSNALALSKASLAEKTEQVAKLSSEKHEVEVEFHSYKEHHGTSNQQQMEAISDLKLTVDRLSHQVETKQVEVRTAAGSLAQQQEYISQVERKLRDAESERRDLHNTIQELKGNIRVFCRVRPSSDDEPSALNSDGSKLSLSHAGENHIFSFDKLFGQTSGQAEMFEEVDGLVQSALDGYKVCIFAYGQTGSGKTFTMQGTKESWGLIPRALRKILSVADGMRSRGWEWTLQASFMEIYNEQLRDLLHDKDSSVPSYAIKHDEAWGTVVANANRFDVSSFEQISSLMSRAAKQRAVGCTDMNSQSSRSHSIFAMYLKGTNSELGTELHGALHLVDLAGSERLDKSGATGAALKETQSINKSLSTLASVFSAKAAGQPHVPFRDSKLTYLMEPCLSGQGKTLMLVNVAPELSNAHETLCSLRFAKQVNQCDTNGGRQGVKRSAKVVPGSAVASASSRPASAAPTISAAKKTRK